MLQGCHRFLELSYAMSDEAISSSALFFALSFLHNLPSYLHFCVTFSFSSFAVVVVTNEPEEVGADLNTECSPVQLFGGTLRTKFKDEARIPRGEEWTRLNIKHTKRRGRGLCLGSGNKVIRWYNLWQLLAGVYRSRVTRAVHSDCIEKSSHIALS